MIPVELVFLAIQAGVKLYGGLREAYAASIKEAPITLPLPRVLQERLEGDFGTIAGFITNEPLPADPVQRADFEEQKVVVLPIASAFNTTGEEPPAEQALAARAFRERWLAILHPPPFSVEASDANRASNEAALAMLSIRQWTKGAPGAPVPWQIALGTVVDVAVLWFANDPGAVSTSRREGKALKAFLTAMQKVDFAHARKTEIITSAMIAVLDTVAANPALITNGERETALVKAATSSLGDAIGKLPPAILDNLNPTEMENLSYIAQSLAAATLRAGAATVFENPKLFNIDGPEGAETKVVEQVGKAFLDLMLPVKVGGQAKIDVRGAVSAKGFETLVRAALAAVGDNPEVFQLQGDGAKRLSPLLADLAMEFSKAPLPSSGNAAFAETAAIVVTASARNMETLWPNRSLDPAQNLARGAVVTALDAITGIAGGAGGISAFTTGDVVRLADAVVASVATNPRLMDALPGNNTQLKLALSAMLQALAQQSVRKLAAADAVVIVAAGIEAATLKQPLLEEAKPGIILLRAVLEAVFGALAEVKKNGNDAAKWRAAGSTLMIGLVEAAFDAVAAVPDIKKVTGPALDALQKALVQFISEGQPLNELGEVIARVLAKELQLS